MNLEEFARYHLPALEADEVRFNVQIVVLTAAVKEPLPGFAFCRWVSLAIARSARRAGPFCLAM